MTAPVAQADPLLVAEGITKRFAGITALHAVDLAVAPGEIVGLIGPNGAGKTTFFNCLLGILRPEEGTVRFAGRDVTRLPIYKRARLGFGRTFQRMELFAGMSVRDHFIVADRAHRGEASLWRDLVNRAQPTPAEDERADAVLDLLGLGGEAHRPAESLSLGRGRLVELGRALMTDPKLLLLDEPSSGLDVKETSAFSDRLLEVQRERGFAVLLVEHDVEMVQRLASRLSVLDFGTLIATGPTAEVFADTAVRKAYLGSAD